MAHVAERHESLVSAFEAFRRTPAFGKDHIGRDREAAFQRFVDAGFPTTRDEDWRFTNVAPIAQTSFVRAGEASPGHAAIEPFLFSILPAIVVVNGRVSQTLSTLRDLPAGITLRKSTSGVDFRPAAGLRPASTENRHPRSIFADLNTAFAEDAVVLDIAPKTIATAPVQVLFVTVSGPHAPMVAPRLVVHVGEGAECSVIESYATIGDTTTFTNAVTEFDLAPSAILDHVKIQRESLAAFHIASTAVRLDRASTFASRSLTFGGRITRNDVTAVLDGDGAECTLNGLYVAGGDSLVDNHTTIDHAKPHCPSHEVYKGILSGRAKAVFNGRIIVELDAQKTNAKQTNKALLLSDDAQINTKPQLEIFADDVKCTHGAAIGQLDEDAMFYLRARGIGETEARAMLIHAFAGQVLEEIRNDAVRAGAQKILDDKLQIG
jgi:Fe-S cluster assembly protein SufD